MNNMKGSSPCITKMFSLSNEVYDTELKGKKLHLSDP